MAISLAALSLAAGCATESGPGKRQARFRPDMTNRSPWLWTDDTGIKAPVRNDPVQANPGTTAVTPPPAGSNTINRVLKRGDKIVIYLRDIGPSSEEIKDEVDANGNVNLPLIGTVHLEGKTTAEAEVLIAKMYIDGAFYQKVSVILTAQEDEFFVQGEVKREGRYPLSRDLTLLQAMATAGSYTDYAKKSRIKIIRGDKVLEFNAEKIEERKEKDPLIKPGDIIVVPRRIIF